MLRLGRANDGGFACGISEHNEEFITWGSKADSNYRKYLNQIKSFYHSGGRKGWLMSTASFISLQRLLKLRRKTWKRAQLVQPSRVKRFLPVGVSTIIFLLLRQRLTSGNLTLNVQSSFTSLPGTTRWARRPGRASYRPAQFRHPGPEPSTPAACLPARPQSLINAVWAGAVRNGRENHGISPLESQWQPAAAAVNRWLTTGLLAVCGDLHGGRASTLPWHLGGLETSWFCSRGVRGGWHCNFLFLLFNPGTVIIPTSP